MSTIKFVLASIVFFFAAFSASCAFNGARFTMDAMETTVIFPAYDLTATWHRSAVGDPWGNEQITILQAANIAASRKALEVMDDALISFDDLTEDAEEFENLAIRTILN